MITTKNLRPSKTQYESKMEKFLEEITDGDGNIRVISRTPQRVISTSNTAPRPTMLTTSKLQDVRMNEKRKRLMEKIRGIKFEKMVDLTQPVTIEEPQQIIEAMAESIPDDMVAKETPPDEPSIEEVAKEMGAKVVKKRRRKKKESKGT